MTHAPLIIRNRTPWAIRAIMLFWIALVAMITAQVNRQEPPPTGHYWPYALALFWLAGAALLVVTLFLEDGRLVVERPRRAQVVRGPFWRQTSHRLSALELKIEKGSDSDGGDYFKLMLTAPPRPLAIAEGHRRDKIEAIKARIEAAFAGGPVGEGDPLA